MLKYHEETRDVSVLHPGRWVWNDESQTVKFISSAPGEDGVLNKKRQTNVNFNSLQRRSEWLAEVSSLNHRGRHSIRKSLSPIHLNAYRSSVMQRQRDHVSIDDVKQVAVSLLQENYLLPIPFCFLAVLKSKALDDVLTALLLYLSCYFEHKSLKNKPKRLMVVDVITEHQMMEEALAKLEIAQKKLAVCYFSLIMDLNVAQHRHTAYHKGQLSPNSTEWLLHACLYSFFCYVAWVTFGRKDLRDIQEEVGRLLYSDTFNTALRNRTDGDFTADPKETGCNSTFKQRYAEQQFCSSNFLPRVSQRRPSLSSIVNQHSPLMVSLLPSSKEQSPHLFFSSWARRQSPLQTERCDRKALTEELNQQLASVSFGILGKPLKQFSHSTLIPYGEQKNNRDEDGDDVPVNHVNKNREDLSC
ncbi:hypothetical protein PAMP_008280 [Pampus punctatissimus]